MRPASVQSLRAFLAVAMAVLFYAIAAATTVLLVLHLREEWNSPGGFHWSLGNVALALSAVAIPWGLWPRPDAFAPPGPRLEPAAHPSLFRVIEEVAASSGQAMPEEVYLAPEYNAWVRETEEPGRAGGKRIMAIGYPLFLTMSVASLRAILAHEFGHYHGGDVRLGLRFYRVDRMLVRTVNGLRFLSAAAWLPFYLYYLLFRVVTMAVSRRQEYAADCLAATLEGGEALAAGLRTLHAMAPGCNAYWDSDLKAILDAGVRPPVLEGFRRAVGNPHFRKSAGSDLEEALVRRRVRWTDSHPSLPRRLEALGAEPDPRVPEAEETAASLLGAVDELEDAFLAGRDLGELRPVSWEQVGETVEIPRAEELVSRNRWMLRGLTPADFPTRKRDLGRLARRTRVGWMHVLDSGRKRHTATLVLGGALILLLRGRGWRFDWIPGEPLVCHREGERIHPYRVVDDLLDGSLALEEWLRTAEKAGIEDVALESVLPGTGRCAEGG